MRILMNECQISVIDLVTALKSVVGREEELGVLRASRIESDDVAVGKFIARTFELHFSLREYFKVNAAHGFLQVSGDFQLAVSLKRRMRVWELQVLLDFFRNFLRELQCVPRVNARALLLSNSFQNQVRNRGNQSYYFIHKGI